MFAHPPPEFLGFMSVVHPMLSHCAAQLKRHSTTRATTYDARRTTSCPHRSPEAKEHKQSDASNTVHARWRSPLVYAFGLRWKREVVPGCAAGPIIFVPK